MATTPKVVYDIEAKAHGDAEVKALGDALRDMGGAITPQMTEQARSLQEEMKRLGQEQRAIARFSELSQATGAARDRLAEATAAFKSMLQQVQASEQPTAAQRGQLDKLSDTLAKARERATAASGALGEARKDLQNLGLVPTTNLDKTSDQLGTLRQRAEQLKGDLSGMRAQLERLGDGAKAAEALDAAFRTLGTKSIHSVTDEVVKLKGALDLIKGSNAIGGAEKERAVSAFNARVAELTGNSKQASAGLASVASSSHSVGDALSSAAIKATTMVAALAGLNSATDVAKNVIATGASFQQLESRLTTLLGGLRPAQQAMEDLKRLARETPFEMTALADSFTKLTAFGLQPSETQMRALADTAAALGGGTEVLTGVTLALGQAWAKGKLQGEEILQLAERGVPVWDALSKATGRNTFELQRMSEAGQLGRDVIVKLWDQLGKQNLGASAAQMATFNGAVSNAKDTMSEFFDMVSRSGVLDHLTQQINDLLAEVDRMRATGELADKARAISQAMIDMADTVRAVGTIVAEFSGVITIALEAMAVKKVVEFTAGLLGLQTAAKAAAVEMAALNAASVASGAATVGAGAAAGTAAAGLGLAARAAGLLGLAMRAIPGAAVFAAVVTVIDQLTSKFRAAKQSAEAGEKAVRAMLTEAASGPPPKAVDEVAIATERAAIAAAGLAKKSSEARRGVVELGLDADKYTGGMSDSFIKAAGSLSLIAQGLPQLKRDGVDTFSLVGDALQKMLAAAKNQQDLDALGQRVRTMGADAGWSKREMDAFFDLIKAKSAEVNPRLRDLGIAAQKAGVEAGLLTTGIRKGFDDSLQPIKDLSKEIEKSGISAEKASPILAAALNKRIEAAQTREELELVGAEVIRLRDKFQLTGRDADDALTKTKEKIEALSPALEAAQRDAALLGVRLSGGVGKGVEESLRAYERLKSGGKATADELQQAFVNLANTAIKANGGIVPEWVKAEAAARGVVIAVDDVGRASVTAGRAGADAARAMSAGFGALAGEVANVAAQMDSISAAARKARNESDLSLYTKGGARYDANGFSKDSAGNTIAGGGQLKPPDDSGNWVFVNEARSNVAAQKAGENSLVVQGIGYWKNTDPNYNGIGPARGGASGAPAPVPAAPAPQTTPSTGQPTSVHRVDIAINGQTTSIATNTNADALALQGVLRTLEAAANRSSTGV